MDLPRDDARPAVRTSISRRFLVALTITAGLSSALVVALLAAYETRTANADLAAEIGSSVSAFAQVMEPALWDLDFGRGARLADAFARDPRIARLTVRERTTGTTQTFEPVRTADTALRVMDVRRGDQLLGTVSVAFNRGYYRAQIRRQVVNAALVSLIGLVATLVGLRVFLRRLFHRPLDQLSNVVRGYAAPSPPPFASAIPYEEFAELGRVLDSMSAQIRHQLAALSAANRELATLNRFLAAATADVEPAELVAEAARELKDLFGASRVRADLDEEHGPAETVYTFSHDDAAEEQVAAVAVPIVVNARPIGTITLARDGARPFQPAELGVANAVASQAAAAIARYRARAAERLLRIAIEQLPESVVITDHDRRIVYVNPGFTAMTGYPAAEAIGRNPRELKRAPDEDGGSAALNAALDAGETWVGRLTNVKKSGETYFEQIVVTPVREDHGEITNHVAVSRDVTAEMQRDEQYRHAQRMDAVGQLAGGVAHDFNNMLGAVLMQLELVELEEALSPSLRQALHQMRAALERAANLTRQLLVFSRRQAMRVGVHDLNVIVDEMLRILTRVLDERIAIEFVRAAEPVSFEGDAGMIEQVVVNLCVNARDAMPSGGRLVIRTGAVSLDERSEHPGTWARLEVRDTGTGMSPEVRSRIFEPFFTTKEVGEGTGLGLATTHGIVTQHGGWIDVDSALGEGTTFRVYLPALVGAVPAAEPSPPRDVVRGNATVLVVEDEPLVRRTVSHSLQRLGHLVLEATSGPEALHVWAERGDAIDLVITDMVMPGGISGVQLVEQMLESRPALRAIVMSGYSLQLSSEAVPSGISFLTKPFSLAALSGAIDQALGRRAA
jgi:PAS domain S-box-containing protein